jgi:predicted RNase H-like nuclease (RuvC/YqgF family)
MQEKLRYRYPAAIFEILEHKNHQQSEYLEYAEQRILQSDIEASRYKQEKADVDQKNYALTAENERLQKIIRQQNKVLRNLQDRLDSVNNSGQQFG